MNKKLLIVGIAVLLICVELSGCTDDINITPKNIDDDSIDQQNTELGGGQGYIIGYQGSHPNSR